MQAARPSAAWRGQPACKAASHPVRLVSGAAPCRRCRGLSCRAAGPAGGPPPGAGGGAPAGAAPRDYQVALITGGNTGKRQLRAAQINVCKAGWAPPFSGLNLFLHPCPMSAGIGFETAKALLERGFYVVLGCRDAAKAEAARARLKCAAAPAAAVGRCRC